jgi:hypothetical protein
VPRRVHPHDGGSFQGRQSGSSKDNPVEVFTKGTGGSEFGFHGQRSLEEAIQRAGEELHSQYTISYDPNNKDEGSFHQIIVQAGGQTRPGYWLAPK